MKQSRLYPIFMSLLLVPFLSACPGGGNGNRNNAGAPSSTSGGTNTQVVASFDFSLLGNASGQGWQLTATDDPASQPYLPGGSSGKSLILQFQTAGTGCGFTLSGSQLSGNASAFTYVGKDSSLTTLVANDGSAQIDKVTELTASEFKATDLSSGYSYTYAPISGVPSVDCTPASGDFANSGVGGL
jgi:hypothetical protein